MKQLSLLAFIFFSAFLFSQENSALKDKAERERIKGNYTAAINLYTTLIKAEPSDFANFQNRALSYHQKGDYSKSIADCNQALALKPGMVDKYYTLWIRGLDHYFLENWTEAFRDIDSSTIFYYDKPELIEVKAMILYKLAKHAESTREWKSILKMPGIARKDSLQAYSMLGFCYLRLDTLSRAGAYANQLFLMDSLSDSYLYLKAAIASNEDNEQQAVAYYTTIIRQDSTDAHAFLCRGTTLNSLGLYAPAMKDLKKSLDMSKDCYYKANYQLAESCNGLKKYDMAIAYYTKCLKVEPKSSEIYNSMAWICVKAKKYPEGLAYVNKSLVYDPKNENAYDTRGTLYYRLGKYDDAINDFDSTLKIDSEYSNSYYFRAWCFIKKSNGAKACEDLKSLQGLQKTKPYKLLDGERPVEELIHENCRNNGKM